MTFTKEFLAELKSKVSLVELADEYTDLTKELNDEWRGPCPHPDHSDSDPSFTIFTKNNEERWYCFGCDTGGDCISGDDMTWRDAVLFLANKYNVNLPTTKHDKEYKRNKLLANKYRKDLKERAYNYLYERGLNNDDIDTFAEKIWNSLDTDNKVSLFVRYINISPSSFLNISLSLFVIDASGLLSISTIVDDIIPIFSIIRRSVQNGPRPSGYFKSNPSTLV